MNPLDLMSLLWMEMSCRWQVVGSVREHCKNCLSFHYRKRRLPCHYIARIFGQNRSRFRVVKYLGVVLSIGNTQLKVPNTWHLKERRYGLKPALAKLSQFKCYPTPKMFHNLGLTLHLNTPTLWREYKQITVQLTDHDLCIYFRSCILHKARLSYLHQ